MNIKTMIAPIISMAHLPRVDVPTDSLHDLEDDGVLYHCGEHGDTDEDGDHPENVYNFPEFNKVLAWGRQNGNGWIRFTDDGNVIPELPTF